MPLASYPIIPTNVNFTQSASYLVSSPHSSTRITNRLFALTLRIRLFGDHINQQLVNLKRLIRKHHGL